MPFLVFDTAIGPTGLAWNDAGITAVQLPEATIARTHARLIAKGGVVAGEGPAPVAPVWVQDAIARIRAHLAGDVQDLSDLKVDLGRVPPFEARVYGELRRVPAGQTVTYADLARRAGAPGEAQAVGRAMARNPFPIVVPCHRVVATDGRLGGFSAHGGLATKDRLLAIEKAPGQRRLL